MTTTRPQSRTLGDLVDELATATPQAPALVSGTERLDFAALKARTDGFARALLGLGIARGDRVALLCSNRSEWVVAAGAAAKLGAPVAAISTFSSPPELAYSLEHSGAKALVMLSRFRDRHFLQALADLCPELARRPPGALQSAALPALRTVVVLDGDASPGTFGPAEFLARSADLVARPFGILVDPDNHAELAAGIGEALVMPKGVPQGLEYFHYDRFAERVQTLLATIGRPPV